ncbi:hypothetical protein NX029_26340 [Cytobacillus firmus]|nr:hypothetical protein [Cytobacillus firmus]
MNNMYVKILVGTHKGKTLFAKSVLHDEWDAILVGINGMDYEYQVGEYEVVSMYK